ncbi:MAG: carbohydrate kinase family protein [Thermoflexales bacterium]|nr:carbohydrate kinase family protein [Thermoflexales bacterium]MDW8352260.1 carbohydrate kinase family protein [Anaerolineae bacterium]
MASAPRVVCFGYVNPGVVFSVDRYPAANTGAYVTGKRPFIGADCAMAAQTLARWGIEAHLIGNALGADDLGRRTLAELAGLGVHAHIPLRRDLRTPDEVDISDRAGTRTFFVEDAPAVWGSLIEADLEPIAGAAMLYVDWYVGPAAERAIAFARAQGVPVFLNVEYSLRHPNDYRHLIARSAYAQSPMSDVHVVQEDPRAIAQALRELGVQVAFVTRGKHGSLAMDQAGLVEIPAPAVDVVDTQGAGAVYSAAAMYGLLVGWPVPQVARFATWAASLKCAQHGLLDASVEAILAQMQPSNVTQSR